MKRVIYLVILSIIIYSCQKLELLEHSNPLDDGRPFVSTSKSDFITSTTAELYGVVIDIGDASITSFGHCWSTSATPTIDNMHQADDNYTSSEFVTNVSGLNPLTKYYFRAFATNSIETAYGDILSFTTNKVGEQPIVTTSSGSNITATSATLLGQIVSVGDDTIFQHGHCWSVNDTTPTINDSLTSLGATGVGPFTSNVSNLFQNTSYYYCAYAISSFGLVYGSVMSFSTTNGEPTVVTIGSNNITASTVDLEGDITGIGNASVTQHGHCWSTSSSPTTNDDKTTLGIGSLGTFTSNVPNLVQNTSYYYRAYSTNSFGTVYGAEMTFITTNGEPTVVTIGSNNITASTVDLEGDITGIGDASVTQHGHCWSTSSSPTTNDDKTTLGIGSLGTFTSNVPNLVQNTSYYYRAYSTNSFGTVYGVEMTFSTPDGLPQVNIPFLTNPISNLTATTVVIEGEILLLGDAPVTQHGHCWSTSSIPTINDDKTTLGWGSLGSYTSNVSNLLPNTFYYYRAYATNNFGTIYYGNNLTFNTDDGLPLIVNGGSTNITPTSVELTGIITDIGDAPITEHGHCWSTTNLIPDINDDKTNLGSNSSGSFISSINNLTASTTYYYRAYATNNFGTAYGDMDSVTTASGTLYNTYICESFGGTFSSNCTYMLQGWPTYQPWNIGWGYQQSPSSSQFGFQANQNSYNGWVEYEWYENDPGHIEVWIKDSTTTLLPDIYIDGVLQSISTIITRVTIPTGSSSVGFWNVSWAKIRTGTIPSGQHYVRFDWPTQPGSPLLDLRFDELEIWLY